MTDAYKCDRCESYEQGEAPFSGARRFVSHSQRCEVHLCGECFEAFETFLDPDLD